MSVNMQDNRMESRRKAYEPATVAQYYETIADCINFNALVERQR
jgi:hypothetical protein